MSANNRDRHRPNAAESDAHRRRRWAPKVRTGCLTCKIRRVKCDEKRPSCEKCLSTGRKCDGYEDEQIDQSSPDHTITKTTRGRRGRPPNGVIERRQRQQHHKSGSSVAALVPSETPYSVSWLPFYGGELEKKHFEFFQSVTSSSLAGFYGSEFWARETLQVAHQYPALFHAITAFGSIHHGYLSDNTPSDIPRMGTNDNFIEFGLQEFNKAIKSMYKLIAQEQISFRDQQAILTTCILFTCLSSLQGRQFQSFMHVKNGMKLIQTWRLNSDKMYRENKKVIDTLVLTFLGLDTQIRPYIGGQESLLQWTDEDIAAPFIDEQRPFESLFDAFFDLEVIANRIFRLSFTKYTSDEWYLDIELLIHQVEAWDDRFSLLLLTVPLSSSELESLDFVRLRREFIRVVLVPLTSQGTSNSHDGVTEIYLEIIDLVEKVLQKESRIASPEWSAYQKPKNPIFVLGSTIIEVLYVVATRSREPTIRRRALQLIKLHPRREGICEAMAASKMVQLLIDIEEQGCPRSIFYSHPNAASSSPFCSTEGEESTPSDTFSLPVRTIPSVSSASPLSSFSSPYSNNNDTTSQSASEAVKEALNYQKATLAPSSNVATTIAASTAAKLPCSEKGQWVCETHRVVDIQYLLITERQLKTVIWTMEDRLLGRKGRELVVSWW